ncbi:NAD(P)-dependent dehydrogenase (short-subunit alcohol dehydrogenase family) [Chitinivorax tropicus]|uniref:NAD(P)-dependent dehydrogenase (Short-subunit alcohol dehydrogenase family) n=1 Tax=Chitinivorax tropicus TaxID=714531 RepID=A0A840MKM2_9PROT|nr:NAD(P)-dependent dehydrogenase (short-subunit alcohol dehydrogenase family) [Chitinivorax tropicus]
MYCYVITGASRGLGLALAQQLADEGHHLVCLARHESAGLQALAGRAASYRFIAQDLADTSAVSQLADELFGTLAAMHWHGLYLINNAGMLAPIAKAGHYDDAGLQTAMAVNLLAPMQLTNALLRHAGHLAIDKRVMNISSGAARKPYQGWSAYCTAKAGLDHYTRCVGVEQAELATGTRIVSIAPGVIDTDMQGAIRAASVAQFPLVEQFKQYQAAGALAAAGVVAHQLLQVLHGDRFGFGDTLDIRDFA